MAHSKLKLAAKAAVSAWCAKNGTPAKAVRHIYPRAYVVGSAAPLCLILSVPWQDAERHLKDFAKRNPLSTVHTFDKSLDAGMWCACAYVVSATGGETVAVPFDA